MMPGMNPRQMQHMMKRMGIQQQEIEATEVVIRCEDREIVITEPQVSKVNMMGQVTYQILGKAVERALSSEPEISEDDIKTVMQQADVDEEAAKDAIKEAKGDLAEAILKSQNPRGTPH